MSQELEELYQEVILDHSRRPRNFGELPDATVLVHGDNPACGDEIHLGVKFGADGALENIKFSGHGCAISQASASLMTMKLKGKRRAEAEEMLRAFHDLVTEEAADCMPHARQTSRRDRLLVDNARHSSDEGPGAEQGQHRRQQQECSHHHHEDRDGGRDRDPIEERDPHDEQSGASVTAAL